MNFVQAVLFFLDGETLAGFAWTCVRMIHLFCKSKRAGSAPKPTEKGRGAKPPAFLAGSEIVPARLNFQNL